MIPSTGKSSNGKNVDHEEAARLENLLLAYLRVFSFAKADIQTDRTGDSSPVVKLNSGRVKRGYFLYEASKPQYYFSRSTQGPSTTTALCAWWLRDFHKQFLYIWHIHSSLV